MKLYFPQVLDWFDRVDSLLVGAFLERWPTLERLQAEDSQEVRKFFHQHQSRSQQRIEGRLEAIREARAMVHDAAVIEPSAMVVRALLQVVAALRGGITAIQAEIEKVVAGAAILSDYAIFASFPGAGPTMAPRLLVAFGSERDRFAHAGEVQSFSGIAPVVSRSGETQFWTHFRWACPKFVRQTFHEYAALSIPHCAWAKAFYDRQRAKGKGHHAAVRSLAFKWIRILFHCWQTRTLYQEDIYLRAVQHRRPAGKVQPTAHPPATQPCLGFLAPLQIDLTCGSTVELQFKNVAGFWKISTTEA